MINSIEAINGLKTTFTQATDDKPSDKVDYDDFMNLLVAQLRYQDPMEPMDNNEFISQTTSFTQLEQLTKMSQSFEDFTDTFKKDTSDNLLSGASFLGKEIRYSTSNMELKDGKADIKFNLPSGVTDLNVSVYDSMGNIVSAFTPENVEVGENNIIWNGVSTDGSQLPDGIYTYKVNAKNANGDDINIFTFAEGVVDGVSSVDGKLLMNVGNQHVDYNLIYSVKEADIDS